MDVKDVIINILITPIVLVVSLVFAIFIALFEFIRFPIDMFMKLWE